MSIIEGIIAFMRTCPKIGSDSAITVDRYAMADGYSIAPSGYAILKRYARCMALIRRSYVISITCPADTDRQRKENAGLLEGIESWLLQQQNRRNYPQMGKQVMAMEPGGALAYDDMENGNTVYQVTLHINYIEEV